MICINYDHNIKFGLLKFHSGYGKFNLNSPKGYSLKIINAQTASKYSNTSHYKYPSQKNQVQMKFQDPSNLQHVNHQETHPYQN